MFRGNLPATVDPKGRLKIPTAFRKGIEENFGRRLFVTSLNGDCVRIYPFPVWEEIENKIAASSMMKPEKLKFMDFTNYWGRDTELDDQGRVLIHQHLRESAQIEGEVAVMGRIKYLEIWQDAIFRKERIIGQKFTTEDLEALSALGI